MKELIKNAIQESIGVKNDMLADDSISRAIEKAVNYCISSFETGGKILLCGNGGSAADAQHIAAELSGRFRMERAPLHAEALHVNTSYLTAVANDYAFEEIYARLIMAMGKANDVLIAISTSGRSQNIIRAVEEGRKKAMIVIGLTGEDGGELKDKCDVAICVPSRDTARIQEAHILVGHILCDLIEKKLFTN